MVIQTGGVRHSLAVSQAREREALERVERVGREALDELRRMLGILRSSDEQPSLAPQPGLSDLAALADQMQTAGLPVDLRVTGGDALPAGIGLTVYRIVQEALTNVLKHAGPARATVTVAAGERLVLVEVVDDGNGSSQGPGSGHGLVGMRERAAIYSGTLTAVKRDGGGFAVRAELPLTNSGPVT
jgi:signal transduction histidine kinase